MIKKIILSIALMLSASSVYAANDPIQVKGMYVWGEDVETFQPCNDPSVYWLNGEPEALAQLRTQAKEAADKNNQPYQPIYVDLEVTEDVPQGEFAEDYDGVYRLVNVNSVSAKIPAECKRQQVY
ncbi:MAG: hypothetical protein ACRC53_12020 [Plesiomonas sp.]|uniref:hypothetical protein n=1 Tax=Plesiomonas sp. TaxID=2486279 RepID=UPI003F34E05E